MERLIFLEFLFTRRDSVAIATSAAPILVTMSIWRTPSSRKEQTSSHVHSATASTSLHLNLKDQSIFQTQYSRVEHSLVAAISGQRPILEVRI